MASNARIASPFSTEATARLVAQLAIQPVDATVAARTQRLLDQKTKPPGSLGRLEVLACRIAAIRGESTPLGKAIVVMAADHGVTAEGVSAYPSAVTRQMVLNFAAGGAAINVLARQAQAELLVVDMGVVEPVDAPSVRAHRVGPGTRNFTRQPAMSVEQALAAIDSGVTIARELAARGIGAVGLGEMGIGNTTSASAIAAVLTGGQDALDELVGRGTGIDDATWRRKRDAIARGLELHGWLTSPSVPIGFSGAPGTLSSAPGLLSRTQGTSSSAPTVVAGSLAASMSERSEPDTLTPALALELLATVGGFEIAGLVGLTLGAAASRQVVVVDGFITSAAALVALAIEPRVVDYLVAAHRSVEPGHRRVLARLGQTPLLDLDLRLGEGSGAALAMGLLDSALAVLRDMATFASAGVASAS